MEKTLVVKGNLIKARRESKEFKGRKQPEKFFLTVANVLLKDEELADLQEAFANSGEKFTPEWVKNFDGYVNVSSKYDIPVMHVDGVTEPSFEKAVNSGFAYMNALVQLSLNIKEGAIYPKAIKILEEGKEYDAFADFN